MRAVVLTAALLLLLPAPALAESAAHTIYVSGGGTVLAHPDYAVVDIGVVSSQVTAADALHAGSQKMAGVVAAIRGLGIGADDIRTADFSIDAKHPYFPNGGTNNEVISGYTVTNKVSITVHDLAKVAAVIDAAVNAGANASNSVYFAVTDRAKYLDLATAAAVRDARHRAEVMAAAEHATVGTMISMSSVGQSYGGSDYQTVPLAVTALDGSTPTPILPGLISVSAQAYVTFAVK